MAVKKAQNAAKGNSGLRAATQVFTGGREPEILLGRFPRPRGPHWYRGGASRRRFSLTSILFPMTILIPALPVAAAGWSLLYLLFGGGLIGAIVIFIVAKIFGK
jgi:hypothetical protein